MFLKNLPPLALVKTKYSLHFILKCYHTSQKNEPFFNLEAYQIYLSIRIFKREISENKIAKIEQELKIKL